MRKIDMIEWFGGPCGAALERLGGNRSTKVRHLRRFSVQLAASLMLILVVLSALTWLKPVTGRAAAMPLSCEQFAFSTEEDFVTQGPTPPDGSPIISDGDLLDKNCAVCARNHDLVGPFDISVDVNLGLDAVDVVDASTSLVAFSTELDSPNVGQFTAGDLLATNGTIIANVALTYFFSLGYDIGLDGVHFVGEKNQIVAFLEEASQKSRDDWLQNPGDLAQMLVRYEIDIWFSTEGTSPTVTTLGFLDGDLLSAATGAIIAQNSALLPASVPAGIPTRGVDFGLDAVASGRVEDVASLRFSTEIPYEDDQIAFTDGDVLEYGTGAIVHTNWDLIDCFEPAAKELGLDALHTAPTTLDNQSFLPLILKNFIDAVKQLFNN
jgi:hypothetical protein